MARLLFVHAHPDDETLATGVTIAHYAARGHDVIVLTMTLGEEGEVIPAELAHLTEDRDGRLADARRSELAAAVTRLGARQAFLGADDSSGETAPGRPRWRDSGMAGMPSAHHPRAFVNADPAQAAGLLAAYLREQRPDVVVTYDVGGGYGHPDHVQTRRVVSAALADLAGPERPALFEIVTPRSWAARDRAWLAAHVPAGSSLHVPAADEPYAVSVVDDARVTHVVRDLVARDVQAAALAAHRTQATVFGGDHYALSNDVAARLPGREAFVRLDPGTGAPWPEIPDGWVEGLLERDRP